MFFLSFILEVDSEPSEGHVVDLLSHVRFLRGTRPNKIYIYMYAKHKL